jgi:hypothetical protein
MSREHPDHHDADLVLRVYDLRREPTLRESRAAIAGSFWPDSYEDVKAVLQPAHPLNGAYRQVSSYWEMVYGIVRAGIVHADYFLESNLEGLFLFGKVAPWLEQIRQDASPHSFRNAEWVTKETALGRQALPVLQGRLRRMREARSAAR